MTKKMQQAYCDKFAVQFTHIDNQKEKQWIQDKFECGLGWRDLFSSSVKRQILETLILHLLICVKCKLV